MPNRGRPRGRRGSTFALPSATGGRLGSTKLHPHSRSILDEMTTKPDGPRRHDVLFIIGTGRCGSTIVQEMLTRHPDVAFVSNVDEFASRLNLKGTWNNFVY